MPPCRLKDTRIVFMAPIPNPPARKQNRSATSCRLSWLFFKRSTTPNMRGVSLGSKSRELQRSPEFLPYGVENNHGRYAAFPRGEAYSGAPHESRRLQPISRLA